MAVCMVPMMVHAFTEDAAIKELQEALAVMTSTEEVPIAETAMLQIKGTPNLKRRYADVVENLVEWGLL